uniref:Uncharacterized protein n=1 Tax=Clytia hemisphaerica TaxID=252671 RepID=A0A7M5URT5_9CNID
AELWSVTSSLIASGVRHCHPDTIVSLFNTLIIPKLMYGLELVDLSKSELDSINAQARSCLKSLFNVSKYSKNYISKLYEIPDASSIIQRRKLKLINQLLANKTTRQYTCKMLYTRTCNSSFISKSKQVIINNNLNITDILSGKVNFQRTHQHYDSDLIDQCKYYIDNWYSFENRVAFKAILEERVQRARTEQ